MTTTGSLSEAVSALGPIDPASIRDAEQEKSAPWIVRKLVGSMTGRVVVSSWETLKASGTTIVCLSPWGDSSPFLLPCIRFRDVAVHTIIAATGGMAAVASPVMGPVSDMVVSTVGDSILVEIPVHYGFEAATGLANDLVIEKPLNHAIPIHASRLETTSVKTVMITLKYKHTTEDAALGFYRGSVHDDASLFASVKDYLAVEKGWFSPYLFASGRRPIIPRSMKPDVVFCHGPFLAGDYKIGETLLAESASVISFATSPPPPATPPVNRPGLSAPSISNMFSRSRSSSPEPSLTPLAPPPIPRRLVILVVGLKPHRKLWSTSARPSESVLRYQLLSGCPAIVVPVKLGAPLIAWDTLTLEHLWEVVLPRDTEPVLEGSKFHGIITVLFEFLDLCVDWGRVVLSTGQDDLDVSARRTDSRDLEADPLDSSDARRSAVKDAVTLLVAAAVRSGASKKAREDIDKDRSGIAMWRIA
ncbi:hypothetical protein EIP91_004558 [Steccherinum ochraceum]|uniref:Uncharacterized protein n=1 Tax=Steccherinum ochraceum TaxID=92696 RepID=A0A4R0RB51_9APHY|nr:hypothetical protein EIP91_004558 [Steccherinum ochraceum]